MYRIRDDIYTSAKKNNITVHTVPCDIRTQIRGSIVEKYIITPSSMHYWERLKLFSSVYDPMGWRSICDHLKGKETILFFDEDEEKTMFSFENETDLEMLLSETAAFEFYVTDIKTTFLICFNHHDILYGCGDAYEWIQRYRK